jgi:hypothetical protein
MTTIAWDRASGDDINNTSVQANVSSSSYDCSIYSQVMPTLRKCKYSTSSPGVVGAVLGAELDGDETSPKLEVVDGVGHNEYSIS